MCAKLRSSPGWTSAILTIWSASTKATSTRRTVKPTTANSNTGLCPLDWGMHRSPCSITSTTACSLISISSLFATSMTYISTRPTKRSMRCTCEKCWNYCINPAYIANLKSVNSESRTLAFLDVSSPQKGSEWYQTGYLRLRIGRLRSQFGMDKCFLHLRISTDGSSRNMQRLRFLSESYWNEQRLQIQLNTARSRRNWDTNGSGLGMPNLCFGS